MLVVHCSVQGTRACEHKAPCRAANARWGSAAARCGTLEEPVHAHESRESGAMSNDNPREETLLK
jgi:hypothetical protein